MLFSPIDLNAKLWNCVFCLQRNQFPLHYKDISEINRPAELLQEYTTIDYIMPRKPQVPPIFVFVIDTCLEDDELNALRQNLVVALGLLPPDALVGLITFGAIVNLPPPILNIIICLTGSNS